MAFVGVTASGEKIAYRDGKRYLYLCSVIVTAVPLVAIGLYFLTGGALVTTLIPLLFVFGFIPLADAWLGEDFNNPPPEVVAAMDADPWYRNIAFMTVPLYWAGYVATIAFVGTQTLPWWSWVALAIGVGTGNGGCIALGHELGHKADRTSQIFALLANAVVGYGHFRVEHNRGHHTWVATPEDPASSRFGELIYRFAGRELPGAFVRGWRNEAERLIRKGRSVWSIENEILQGYALTLAVAAALIARLRLESRALHPRPSFHRLVRADPGELRRALRAPAPEARRRALRAVRAAPFVEHQPHCLEPAHLPPAAALGPSRQSDAALPVATRLQGSAAPAERLSGHVRPRRDPAAVVPGDGSEGARLGGRGQDEDQRRFASRAKIAATLSRPETVETTRAAASGCRPGRMRHARREIRRTGGARKFAPGPSFPHSRRTRKSVFAPSPAADAEPSASRSGSASVQSSSPFLTRYRPVGINDLRNWTDWAGHFDADRRGDQSRR